MLELKSCATMTTYSQMENSWGSEKKWKPNSWRGQGWSVTSPSLVCLQALCFFKASELCQTWSSCLLLWCTGNSGNIYVFKRMTWNRNNRLLGILTLSQSSIFNEHCLDWNLQSGSIFSVLQLLHLPSLSCKCCLHMLACHVLCPFWMLHLSLLQPQYLDFKSLSTNCCCFPDGTLHVSYLLLL